MTSKAGFVRRACATLLVLGVVLSTITADAQTATAPETAEFSARGYVHPSLAWADGAASVCFINPGKVDAGAIREVRRAAAKWTAVANLKLTGWGRCEPGDGGVRIRWYDGQPGSYLGNDAAGRPTTMWLNASFRKWGPSCASRVDVCVHAIALHEFGHALGLLHEHDRPDTPPWCVEELGFKTPTGLPGAFNVGPWDVTSVMNYCLRLVDGLDLSPFDVLAARVLYPHDCGGHRPTIIGTDGDDLIRGTEQRDVIFAYAGNDRIFGRGGDDIICGGAGSDFIAGGDGDDLVLGGSGDDELRGDRGNDDLRGGAGSDRIAGSEGNDRIRGQMGPDIIGGGAGEDHVDGGAGRDQIFGGAGNDRLAGQTDGDTISGNHGDDLIIGGLGADELFGGDGSDTLLGGPGDDVVVGDSGSGDRCFGQSGLDVQGGGCEAVGGLESLTSDRRSEAPFEPLWTVGDPNDEGGRSGVTQRN